MMQIGALVSTAIILAQAPSAPSTPSPVDVFRAALSLYSICLTDVAKQYDDHVSDAATIATAIAGLCDEELNNAKMFFDRSYPGISSSIHARTLDDSRQGFALRAVLAERAQARAPRPK
jgi:hypothetical protein